MTEGLASIEKAESELNNIACIGYEEGDRVLWDGATRKGKGSNAPERWPSGVDW